MKNLFIRALWPAAVIACVAYLALTHTGMKDNELAGSPITLTSSLTSQ